MKESSLTVIRSINIGAWVNCLRWSLNGDWLCGVAQNSQVIFVESKACLDEKEPYQVIQHNGLPFMTIFYDENGSVLLGGYDKTPYSIGCDKSKWSDKLQGVEKIEGTSKSTFMASSSSISKSVLEKMQVYQANILSTANALNTGLYLERPNSVHHSTIIYFSKFNGKTISVDASGLIGFW